MLCWSPVHRSPAFWQQNGSKLLENEAGMLRSLASLIHKNVDSQTLSQLCPMCG